MLQQIQTKLHVIRYRGQLACFILQFLTRRKKQWCNMLFERVPRRASLLCRKNIGLLKLHLGEPQDFWNNRFWSHLVNMYCVMFGKDQKQHFGRITTANQQASTVMMMRWRQPQKPCVFQSLSRPWTPSHNRGILHPIWDLSKCSRKSTAECLKQTEIHKNQWPSQSPNWIIHERPQASLNVLIEILQPREDHNIFLVQRCIKPQTWIRHGWRCGWTKMQARQTQRQNEKCLRTNSWTMESKKLNSLIRGGGWQWNQVRKSDQLKESGPARETEERKINT